MDDDVEPERYYEWILWKLRKEKNMKFDERISLFNFVKIREYEI